MNNDLVSCVEHKCVLIVNDVFSLVKSERNSSRTSGISILTIPELMVVNTGVVHHPDDLCGTS